jgi:predicted AAA+ superfamily ATPase
MRQAYLISEVPRSSIKTKEVLSGERKYFLTDIGFRNYLYPSLVNDFGNILENIAFNHLKKAGYNLKVGSASNLEIDFIAESHNTKKYFQIAYLMPEQKTIDREFGALEKINDNFEKIVLSMDDLLINNRNGIKHFQIWDYLYELG